MKKEQWRYYVAFGVEFAALILVQILAISGRKVEPVSYNEFGCLLEAGKIAEVAVSESTLRGELVKFRDDGKSAVVTNRMNQELADWLDRYNVRYSAEAGAGCLSAVLSWVLLTLLFLGVWMFLVRRVGQGAGGGLLAIDKSKARIYRETETGVTFADVAGIDEAKEELREVVDFLKTPERPFSIVDIQPAG